MLLDSNLQINDLPNFTDECIEDKDDFGDGLAGWPLGMAYGYSEGQIAIILHVSLRGIEGEEKKFCATYYRSPQIMELGPSGCLSDEAKLPLDDMLHGYSEQPVLVSIVEFPDKREEGRQLMVPSVVRLRSLDSCLGIGCERGEPAVPLGSELFVTVSNRKLQSSSVGRRIGPTVSDGNAINSVIKSGAEIVHTIAHHKGEPVERRGLPNVNNNGVAATVSVGFVGEAVWFATDPRGHFRLEGAEMFFGTTYFQETASELRTDHAVYTTKHYSGASS